MNGSLALILSLLGGILPALFWLWFWQRQDRLKPEPRLNLLATFIAGAIAVLIALFFENYFSTLFSRAISDGTLIGDFWDNVINTFNYYDLPLDRFALIIILAPVIEELAKFLLTYFFALRRKDNDEPIDASIYLITAALGFSAVENAIFLLEPFTKGQLATAIVNGNFRTIGPMLIHLVASAVIGMFIGFAFYKSKIAKIVSVIIGLISAIVLHASFNLFIMFSEKTHDGTYSLLACVFVWILLFGLLIAFSRVKKVTSDKACLIE
ncbi:MAG: PrsW family glutamic-type intramembrane protease [bacterium]